MKRDLLAKEKTYIAVFSGPTTKDVTQTSKPFTRIRYTTLYADNQFRDVQKRRSFELTGKANSAEHWNSVICAETKHRKKSIKELAHALF